MWDIAATAVGIGYLAAAYLLGGVSFGLILGLVLSKRDVRTIGSKSTGATNTARLLGTWAFFAVIVLDLAKAIGLVVIPLALPLDGTWHDYVVGGSALAVVLGHCWPVWSGFRGGKGVVTLGSGALVLFATASFWIAGGAAAVYVAMILLIFATRLVSVSSLAAAAFIVALGAVLWLTGSYDFPLPYFLALLLGGLVVTARHHANIRLLLKGQERRFKFKRGGGDEVR